MKLCLYYVLLKQNWGRVWSKKKCCLRFLGFQMVENWHTLWGIKKCQIFGVFV